MSVIEAFQIVETERIDRFSFLCAFFVIGNCSKERFVKSIVGPCTTSIPFVIADAGGIFAAKAKSGFLLMEGSYR